MLLGAPVDREPWKIVLAIALCPPLGLYWLWRHPTLKRDTRWWRAVLVYAACVSAFTYANSWRPRSEELVSELHAANTGGRFEEVPNTASTSYDIGFRQGESLGRDDRQMLSVIEERGQSIDEAVLGRVRGRMSKFFAEMLEAEQQHSRGADSRLLDIAKGRYEGYRKGVASYGTR